VLSALRTPRWELTLSAIRPGTRGVRVLLTDDGLALEPLRHIVGLEALPAMLFFSE